MPVGAGSIKRAAKAAEGAQEEKKNTKKAAADKAETKEASKKSTKAGKTEDVKKAPAKKPVTVENHMGTVIYQVNDELPIYLL